MSSSTAFKFKQFAINHDQCLMKVGTDGILLGAWANVRGVKRVLDIGTGSGLIAIMIAQRTKKAQITGVEIDVDSAKQASQNMEECPWPDRLTCVQSSIQDFVSLPVQRFDLIISNPPYFKALTLPNRKALAKHTLTLTFEELILAVKTLLTDRGRFALIFPTKEGLNFISLAKEYGFYCRELIFIHTKNEMGKPPERMLLEFRKKQVKAKKTKVGRLSLEGNGTYKELVSPFYLKM